jgi:hypoxanthine phosphoribosyltransferase
VSVLFSESDIALRVAAIAREIAARRPEIAVAILSGAFVFAADLMRALSREGLDIGIEFLALRSYGNARAGGEISVRLGPSENISGKNVLLIDGVLDHGSTLLKARELLHEAKSIVTAVVADKCRADALVKADFACFTDVSGFIAGYGMDDAGRGRGLPYIVRVD